MAYGILIPQPGMGPVPAAIGVWSLKHWATQRSCESVLFLCIYFSSSSYFGAYSVKRKRAYDNNAWLQKAKREVWKNQEDGRERINKDLTT